LQHYRAHEPENKDSTAMKRREALSLALNLSWTMVFALLVPLFLGIWLDKRLNTTPLFILIGALLGMLAATLGVARMVLRTFPQTVTPRTEGRDSDSQAEANSEEEPA
jgi:F0F1-type ATP synthase assembly protein I